MAKLMLVCDQFPNLLWFGVDEVGLWLSFIAFEREQLRLKEASLLYWRAVKELKDVTSFITV